MHTHTYICTEKYKFSVVFIRMSTHELDTPRFTHAHARARAHTHTHTHKSMHGRRDIHMYMSSFLCQHGLLATLSLFLVLDVCV